MREKEKGSAGRDAGADTPAHAAVRRWPKRLAVVLAMVLVLGVAGFAWYVSDYYHADAQAVSQATAQVPVTETSDGIAVGNPDAAYGLVLYPGAKVEPAAYEPLAAALAAQGVYCVIAKMPFNLAFFDGNAADGLMAAAPQVRTWWIGGHSLGGVAAAQYAAGHTDRLAGIVLLASYATADLSQSGLAALTVYGENDGVLNRRALAQNAGNLPAGAQTVVIAGGTHAGFAAYGPQAGDGQAAVSTAEQERQTAALIVQAMQQAG